MKEAVKGRRSLPEAKKISNQKRKMGAPGKHEYNLNRWNTSFSFNLFSNDIARGDNNKFQDLQLRSNGWPKQGPKLGRSRKALFYSRYLQQPYFTMNFPRDTQRVGKYTECLCQKNQPSFQRDSRNQFKSFTYQRRSRPNRFHDEVVSRKSTSHKVTQKVQISAPANTTQFLIDDFEARYKSVDFSDADLSGKENLGCEKLSSQLEQSLVNDEMPYTFDECFGQMEFEDLYADMQG